jgi:hypothetical protein
LISNHFCDSVGGPEKAGVGGSIPSLATNNFNNVQIAKNIQISSREQYANIRQPTFAAFAHCGSNQRATASQSKAFPNSAQMASGCVDRLSFTMEAQRESNGFIAR